MIIHAEELGTDYENVKMIGSLKHQFPFRSASKSNKFTFSQSVPGFSVVVAFIGVGIAWAMESSTPQFQEKAGTPIVKKHKKFPVLLLLVGVAAVGMGIYFLTKKKDNEEPQPTPLNYTVKIFNTMEPDVQRTVTFSALPGTSKTFTSSDLSISGVYDKYIVMRVEGSANTLGEWLGFGKDKSVNFTTPASNTTLCAYFFDNMDNGRNDLYDKMFAQNGGVEIPPGRDSQWFRFDADGQGGPQSVWDHAANQLNTALAYAFKVGSISATGGTKHKYGYRFCEGGDGYKSFTEFWIGVNSDKLGLNYVIGLERIALEEWFEYASYTNNPDNMPAQMTICDPQKSDLNTTGTRLIRAMYTAHNKNINFE